MPINMVSLITCKKTHFTSLAIHCPTIRTCSVGNGQHLFDILRARSHHFGELFGGHRQNPMDPPGLREQRTESQRESDQKDKAPSLLKQNKNNALINLLRIKRKQSRKTYNRCRFLYYHSVPRRGRFLLRWTPVSLARRLYYRPASIQSRWRCWCWGMTSWSSWNTSCGEWYIHY